jgi:hypothetical protein
MIQAKGQQEGSKHSDTYLYSPSYVSPFNFHVQRTRGCGGGRNRSPDSDNGITLDLHPPSLPDKPLAAPILGQISAAIAM